MSSLRSLKDMMNKVVHKMKDYRAAKVKVVWHILPNHKEVQVYTGDKLDKMTVCTGTTVCSAAPALPGFALPAEDVFKNPSVN